MESKNTLPTIHLNGTHPTDLFDQARAVRDAAAKLLVALQMAYPNGRDYYVQGNQAFTAADSEACARLEAVREIKEWAGQIAKVCLTSPGLKSENVVKS